MKTSIVVLAMLFTVTSVKAQNVGIGTSTPAASARLDVSSTTSGFLPPRMTAAERSAIAAPAEGLIVYQTDAPVNVPAGLYLFRAGAWVIVNGGNSVNGNGQVSYVPKWVIVAPGDVNLLGNSQIFDNGVSVGINTTTPGAKLHVNGSFRLTDGTQAAGSVLVSNTQGTGTWQDVVTPNEGIGLRTVTGPTLSNIPDNVITPIIWLSTDIQNGGVLYDIATGEVTIAVSGLYQINASACFGNSTSLSDGFIGTGNLRVRLNGNDLLESESGIRYPELITPSVSCIKELNAGDKLLVVLFVTTTNPGRPPVQVKASSKGNYFSIQLLHK